MGSVLVFLLSVFVLWLVWTFFWSPAAQKKDPEFKDMRGVVRTDSLMDSSYAQRTNHMPQPPVVSPPVEGLQTPFQVNAYTAYVK